MTLRFRRISRRILLLLGMALLGVALAAVASTSPVMFSANHPAVLITQAASPDEGLGSQTEFHELPVISVAIEESDRPSPSERADEPTSELSSENSVAPAQDNADGADSGPIVSHDVGGSAPTPEAGMDEVNQYLWSVYLRTAKKQDGTGDFTWKDVAAAARMGITLGDYVIRGMDPDFREILYRAGQAMDGAGMRWTILSAFRDDYRQGLASGYKARIGNSLHGGSIATGGYGHGCAVDITDAEGKSFPLWQWVDITSTELDIERPLPGLDPAHVQPRGPWHEVAAALRKDRLASETPSEVAVSDSEMADISGAAPSETDMMCIGLHHHHYDPLEANTQPLLQPQSFKLAARAHVAGKLPSKSDKLRPKANTRLAARSPAAETRLAGKVSRAAEAERSERSERSEKSSRAKAAGRSPARHALHAIPQTAHTA